MYNSALSEDTATPTASLGETVAMETNDDHHGNNDITSTVNLEDVLLKQLLHN